MDLADPLDLAKLPRDLLHGTRLHIHQYEAMGPFAYGGVVDLYGELLYDAHLREALHPVVDGGIGNVQCLADVHEGHPSVLPEIPYDFPVDFIQFLTQRLSLGIKEVSLLNIPVFRSSQSPPISLLRCS